MISSHIYFTQDGLNPIESKSIQHSARRKQGKNWWNDDWRNKLLSFVKYLSDDESSIYLEVGSEERIIISNKPLQFKGYTSYTIPERNTLLEEAELAEIYGLDTFEDELTESLETE